MPPRYTHTTHTHLHLTVAALATSDPGLGARETWYDQCPIPDGCVRSLFPSQGRCAEGAAGDSQVKAAMQKIGVPITDEQIQEFLEKAGAHKASATQCTA